MKTFKVEENVEYSPALLKRVKEAEDNIKKGKYKVVENGDLWDCLK